METTRQAIVDGRRGRNSKEIGAKKKSKTPEQPSEKPFNFFGGDEDESGWNDQDSDWTLFGRMP